MSLSKQIGEIRKLEKFIGVKTIEESMGDGVWIVDPKLVEQHLQDIQYAKDYPYHVFILKKSITVKELDFCEFIFAKMDEDKALTSRGSKKLQLSGNGTLSKKLL